MNTWHRRKTQTRRHFVCFYLSLTIRNRIRKLDCSVICCFCNFLFIPLTFCHILLAAPWTDQFVYVTVSWFHGIFPAFMLPQHNRTWDHLHTRARLSCPLASVSSLRSSVSGLVSRYRLNRFILKLATIGNDLASFCLCISYLYSSVVCNSAKQLICLCVFDLIDFDLSMIIDLKAVTMGNIIKYCI